MNRSTVSLFLAACFALHFSIGCASTATSGAAHQPHSSRLDELAWLSGHWSTGEMADGTITQEHWTTPSRDGMFGIGRTIKDGQEVFFEYLRIAETGGAIVYLASPEGRRPPTPFTAVAIESNRVVFENLEHDFPQRIIYELPPGGDLHARIEGEAEGALRVSQWTLYRDH